MRSVWASHRDARSWRIIRSLFAIWISITVVACQSASESDSDTETLFQKELDALRAEYQFPGATAAYVLDDGRYGVVSTGFADAESRTPLQPSTRMLAASIGKTFVSATVLALEQEGQIDLDGYISDWLGDEEWFHRLPNGDAVTVRHLLSHTSGIANHVDDPAFTADFRERWAEPENSFTPEALIGYVLDQPPLFEPGEGWAYSDTGYVLLGLIIEKTTGRSYYDEVTDRFLVRFDLALTSPSDRRDLPNLATGYMSPENQFGLPERTMGTDGLMHWNPAIEWTGGGLVSNSLDLSRWAKALFEGRAIEGDYLEDLLREVQIDADYGDVGYGAGVSIHRESPIGTWYGHSGWIPGYTSTLRYYVDQKAALAFQINTDIGIVDGSTDLYDAMASRLEKIIAETGTE